MKTATKIGLLIGILLLAFGLTVLQIAHHRGEDFSVQLNGVTLSNARGYDQKGYTVCRSGEESFSAKDVRSLKLDWLSGSATVVRYEGKEVLVSEKASVKLSEDECLRWKLSGGELSILPCANGVRNLPTKELTVLVPWSLTLEDLNVDVASASAFVDGIDTKDKLAIDAASGSLSVESCRCGELKLNSASGSQTVRLTEVRGDVDAEMASGSFTAASLSCGKFTIESGSGSLRAEELSCRSAKAHSASGSVKLGFAEAPEKVEVDTASGSVTLGFPKGTGLDVDYDTASGRLYGEVVYGDLPVDVDTASGSLTIEYR